VTWEVELKFAVGDRSSLVLDLLRLGAIAAGESEQSDTYFAHPCRDFVQSNEAFRLRTVDGQHCLTYKGPVVDRTIKTRKEIEIPCGNGADSGTQWRSLIEALGFHPVREVRKHRRRFTLVRNGRHFEFCLDRVPPLGDFAEIETLVETGDRDTARELVWSLAHELGLSTAEPRSYLELLLLQDRTANS
jgi:adenylate cyclase, class 2